VGWVGGMRLYHYTCRHSIFAIVEQGGTLKPNPAPGWQKRVPSFSFPVVWLTDVDVRSRDDARLIGLAQLGGNITDCYRIEWRLIVPRVGVVPWSDWADENADHMIRFSLEESPGADPEHWFVAPRPISGARVDEHYRAPR
jgi:hypothetical protein